MEDFANTQADHCVCACELEEVIDNDDDDSSHADDDDSDVKEILPPLRTKSTDPPTNRRTRSQTSDGPPATTPPPAPIMTSSSGGARIKTKSGRPTTPPAPTTPPSNETHPIAAQNYYGSGHRFINQDPVPPPTSAPPSEAAIGEREALGTGDRSPQRATSLAHFAIGELVQTDWGDAIVLKLYDDGDIQVSYPNQPDPAETWTIEKERAWTAHELDIPAPAPGPQHPTDGGAMRPPHESAINTSGGAITTRPRNDNDDDHNDDHAELDNTPPRRQMPNVFCPYGGHACSHCTFKTPCDMCAQCINTLLQLLLQYSPPCARGIYKPLFS